MNWVNFGSGNRLLFGNEKNDNTYGYTLVQK